MAEWMRASTRPTGRVVTIPLRRRARRWGTWPLLAGILIVLTLSGLGATYLLAQAAGPEQVVTELCDDLRAQRYADVATLLTGDLRAPDAMLALAALDTAEGPVVACQQDTRGGQVAVTGETASMGATLTRAKLGDLRGAIHLRRGADGWRVDGLDAALLGAPLGAVRATLAYCAALRSGDYAAAYGLLTPDAARAMGAENSAAFAEMARAEDMVAGVAQSCALAAVGQGNTERAAHLTLSVTRGRVGTRTGTLTLAALGSGWRITALDAALQGGDLGPLAAGQRLCAALARGNLADAYALFSAEYQRRVPVAAFAPLVARHGAHWTGCVPDLATYAISGAAASYTATFTALGATPGTHVSAPARLSFTLAGDGAWRVDELAWLR
jgi:hypothetical protein